MDLLEPPPHAHHIVTSGGECFIWQARPDILIRKASGILTLPMAQSLTDFMRPILEPGMNCRFFSDFEQLTHHTREAREHMNAFALENVRAIRAAHFLISSKFVALGLSTFKEESGLDVWVYSDRASFLRSLTSALAEHAADAR